jgi:hypothetical protein
MQPAVLSHAAFAPSPNIGYLWVNPQPVEKGILKTLAFALVMTSSFSSCEEILDCKTCEAVSVTNGVETRGPGIRTCGDELAEKEDYYESYGNTTSYYDCY